MLYSKNFCVSLHIDFVLSLFAVLVLFHFSCSKAIMPEHISTFENAGQTLSQCSLEQLFSLLLEVLLVSWRIKEEDLVIHGLRLVCQTTQYSALCGHSFHSVLDQQTKKLLALRGELGFYYINIFMPAAFFPEDLFQWNRLALWVQQGVVSDEKAGNKSSNPQKVTDSAPTEVIYQKSEQKFH